MNQAAQTARRYHWHSERATDLVCEPHAGIASQARGVCLDLTARASGETRLVSTGLTANGYSALMNDIRILRKHSGPVSRMAAVEAGGEQMVFAEFDAKEFHTHPVVSEDFSRSRYLEKVLWIVCDRKPETYENLLAVEGVGPKTMRALSLVSEVIYGAAPSYEDPARYSFAHGGKDATPYPVDRRTYDATIRFFDAVVRKMRLAPSERDTLLRRLSTRSR